MPRKPKPRPFGEELTRLKEARGYTSYRLAKLAGLPLTTVRLIELGADPKWSTVLRLADALDVPTDAFRHPDLTPARS